MTDRSPTVDMLNAAGRRLRLAAVSYGVAWCVTIVAGCWTALCVGDNLLRFPPALRLPLALAAAAAAAFGLARKLLPAARLPPPERVALHLEREHAVRHNLLINACRLERQALDPSERSFADRLAEASLQTLAAIPRSAPWRSPRLVPWLAGGAVALLLALLYASAFSRYAVNATMRLARPLADIPPASAAEIAMTPDRDVLVAEGESLALRVTLKRGRGQTPGVVWREHAATVDAGGSAAEAARMLPLPRTPDTYTFAFNDIRVPFAYRVVAGDGYTKSVKVGVIRAPRLERSAFVVRPPAYTGLDPLTTPGPPAPVQALAGSAVRVDLAMRPEPASVTWRSAETTMPFSVRARMFEARFAVASNGAYRIDARDDASGKSFTVARGQVALQRDNPPAVDFVTADRNRFISEGAELPLAVEASDDFGIRSLAIAVRGADDAEPPRELKAWRYLGPPGNRGPIRETVALRVDPRVFRAGETYLVEALCDDFGPAGNLSRSRPIVLRVRNDEELKAGNDPLGRAIGLLQETVALQRKANGVTGNVEANIEDIARRGTFPDHCGAMADRQGAARAKGAEALAAFKTAGSGAACGPRLRALVDSEMAWVLGDIARLKAGPRSVRASALAPVRERQDYILNELIALLGKAGDLARQGMAAPPPAKGAAPEAVVTAKDIGLDLKENLKELISDQKKIIEKSRTLADRAPADLSPKDEAILGELAREEAKWAAFFEEKLTDFSKLPLQDFGDSAMAQEFNEVFMEIKKAAQSLHDKKMELAVPQEQSGLENAAKLEHNLERWLPDTPDNIKWSMEEPPDKNLTPTAELPTELEDIVGQLLDKEEAMSDDVEDVTSSWLDSLDNGAGWDAMDGPISDMGAKGVTGNRLPNQMEIGGRAGEGRSGRSCGQFVEQTAAGKQGRDTPTRLTPSPYEAGSVEDGSKESPGGATGGGKLSGYTGEGLRGPAPPPAVRQKMVRLAGRQAAIRQEAEALAMKLRAYHLPSGDVETSAANMRRFEGAAGSGQGVSMRQAFSRAVDALQDAQGGMTARVGLRREATKRSARDRDDIMMGLQDGVPRGYEDMVGAYFRALAEPER